jgi:hypothetical protein
LSSPHLEASPATTFRACSLPAPTPVKPQPAPAILSQESVHTTLSITHHIRKRPSTGPRTTHGPHVRNRDNEARSRNADLGRNRTRAELPAHPNRTRATASGPSHGGDSAGGDPAIIPHRDPGGGGSDGGSSNHGADRRAGGGATTAAEATRTATSPAPHVAASTPTRKSKNYDARRPPRQATATTSPPSLRDFATYSSQRNSSLWELPSRREARFSAVAQMLRLLH